MRHFKNLALLIALAAFPLCTQAQEEKPSLLIDLSYHVRNNQFPWLEVYTKTKEGKKFVPVPGIEVNVYFGEAVPDMLMNKVLTAENGKARIPVSARFKPMWDGASEYNFIATSAGNRIYDPVETEINITRAKVFLDTVENDDIKTLSASVHFLQDGAMVPAAEVELKIFVKRMAGTLSVGEDESYTTDSTGTGQAEFIRDSIPGDQQGFITIVAKTEDNDQYGQLVIEKTLPWGKVPVIQSGYGRRSLFATRDRSPLWLLFLAYSSAIGVWGTIIYLFTRIALMRRVGKAAPDS